MIKCTEHLACQAHACRVRLQTCASTGMTLLAMWRLALVLLLFVILGALARFKLNSLDIASPRMSESAMSGMGQNAAKPHFTQTSNSSSDFCQTGAQLPGAWTGHAAGLKTQLPNTREVQAILWAHQHPPDCSSASFLVYSAGNRLGIGAKLDYLAAALGRALDLGRVLLIDYDDKWVQGPFCKGLPTLDACFFEQISSCNLTHIYGEEFTARPELYENVTTVKSRHSLLNSSRILFEHGDSFLNVVPDRLQDIVSRSSLLEDAIIGGVQATCYWWRAQGVSYIVRPNARTLLELTRLKREHFNEEIRPGTLSIHVRHGDKIRDGVPFVPDEEYDAIAAKLISSSGGSITKSFCEHRGSRYNIVLPTNHTSTHPIH